MHNSVWKVWKSQEWIETINVQVCKAAMEQELVEPLDGRVSSWVFDARVVQGLRCIVILISSYGICGFRVSECHVTSEKSELGAPRLVIDHRG